MKTESPAPAPLVSDEELTSIALGVMTKEQVRKNRELQHSYNASYVGAARMRDIYESELTKMRAERDELVYALRHSALAMNVVRSSLTSAAKRLRLQNGLDKAQAVLSKYKTE